MKHNCFFNQFGKPGRLCTWSCAFRSLISTLLRSQTQTLIFQWTSSLVAAGSRTTTSKPALQKCLDHLLIPESVSTRLVFTALSAYNVLAKENVNISLQVPLTTTQAPEPLCPKGEFCLFGPFGFGFCCEEKNEGTNGNTVLEFRQTIVISSL